jgi:hypothetical protein
MDVAMNIIMTISGMPSNFLLFILFLLFLLFTLELLFFLAQNDPVILVIIFVAALLK